MHKAIYDDAMPMPSPRSTWLALAQLETAEVREELELVEQVGAARDGIVAALRALTAAQGRLISHYRTVLARKRTPPGQQTRNGEGRSYSERIADGDVA